jgi:hypothetical protein
MSWFKPEKKMLLLLKEDDVWLQAAEKASCKAAYTAVVGSAGADRRGAYGGLLLAVLHQC